MAKHKEVRHGVTVQTEIESVTLKKGGSVLIRCREVILGENGEAVSKGRAKKVFFSAEEAEKFDLTARKVDTSIAQFEDILNNRLTKEKTSGDKSKEV